MQLGLVGLGKMGGNMRERIRRAGHEVVGYDRNKAVSDVVPRGHGASSSTLRAWCG
jgi:6-phosphogluconate dehydrogenase (decarboxylating)